MSAPNHAFDTAPLAVSTTVAPDPRPQFRVAVFGLAARGERLLQIVLRHSQHNRYRFVLASSDAPGDYDVAMVDMTAPPGRAVAEALGRSAHARPIVTVGRRNDATRVRDDLMRDAFPVDVLKALNRVVERSLLTLPAGEPGGFPAMPGMPVVNGRAGGMAIGGPGKGPLARARVLLVDPSLAVRRQLSLALGPIGIDLEGVATLAEACSVLEPQRYRLVIAEVSLPDGDGLALARQIRRDRLLRPLPVIMLTARSSPMDLLRGAMSGCECYLVKPVTLATLRQSVGRCLVKAAAQEPAARLEAA